MNKLAKYKLAIGTFATTAFISTMSLAADTIDVSAGTALIDSGKVAVAAIGGGLLGLAIIMAVYRKLQKQ